jgi:hypothetical protein
MALSGTDVNTTQKFGKTKLIDKPLQTYKASPKVRPNPFTGKGQTDAYAKKHHLSSTPPTTVAEATETNPIT